MQTSSLKLGRLEPVDLRSTWASEAGDFTPWLAEDENMALLADTVGIDLEVEAQEKRVGPFRADILCKDTASGNWVLIENQLERTDHVHLGQLLTYASGLKAVTIVWIANKFTEEHRAALDWLNDITDDRFNFFGLEVELWRIGSSAVAPKFNIISKPNDWSKTVAQGAREVENESMTELRKLQLEFWAEFHSYCVDRQSTIRATKPLPQNWMNISIGRTGFQLAAIASLFNSEAQTYDSHELRAELQISGTEAKAYFSLLEAEKLPIESDFGSPLSWHNPEDKKQCRIYVQTSVDLECLERWPEYCKWLCDHLEEMQRVFRTRVKRLDVADAGLEDAEA